jgi:hypothetical protein
VKEVEMKILKNFPFWVAVYIATVGLLFSLLPVAQTSLMELKAPNKYYLMGVAFIFFISGCWYGFAALRGKLEPRGVSVAEVRKQALEKIESKTYLAKTAKGDPDPEVRKKAIERLEEITA